MRQGLFIIIISCGLGACQNQKSPAELEQTTGSVDQKNLDTFIVDPGQSLIYWAGSSPSAQHNGLLKIAGGEIYFSKGQLVSGEVTADMKSIRNLNLEKESERLDLEDHLKDPDFFSVDTFPESEIKLVAVEMDSDSSGNYLVKANLTIKGISKPVIFRCVVDLSDNSALLGVHEFSIDRTDFGIMYQSKKILPNLIDGFIHDEIKLSVKLFARKNK